MRQLVSTLLKKKGIILPPKEMIPKRPVFSPCPASFAQQRLWMLEKVAPGSRYNMQVSLRLKGRLDLHSLNNAWREVVNRHEILRTTFALVDDQIMQFVSPEPSLSLRLLDLTADALAEAENQASHILGKQAQEVFDLATAPLIHFLALRIGADDYILSFTMHHIIADGWSLTVLARELTELYAAFSEDRPHGLKPLAVQYGDFSWWQRQRLSGDFLEKELSYWRKQLKDAAVLGLPTDHPRPTREEFRGSHSCFLIPEEIAGPLREIGGRNQASLFMVIFAAWQVLLYRYTGQNDIVVGAPVANRTRVEIEPLIGFFVNTLVLRTEIDGNSNFKDVLSLARKTTLAAYEHQEVPYEKLVADLQPERAIGQNPLFGTVLNWVNIPESNLGFAGLQDEVIQSAPAENLTAKFDLSLNILERSGALSASLEYSTDLFEKSTIEQMSIHFQHLLRGIAANLNQSVAELPLLNEDERRQIVWEWNRTEREYPAYGTVLDLLDQQARKTPEHPAVEFAGKSISYNELHCRSNQVCDFLRKLGVRPEVRVGIFMERSHELVIALLGILKAGGAYVPLDLRYPTERLSYILDDARPIAVLTQRSLQQALPESAAKIICLDDDEEWNVSAGSSQGHPVQPLEPGNAAYVIYTSGSTGVPKGVVVQHGSVLNYLLWVSESLFVGSIDCLPAVTGLGFDASLKQILGPLVTGGTVYVLADGPADPQKLLRFISSQRRVALNCVPSFWLHVVEEIEKNLDSTPANLAQLWLGGESCTPDLIERSLRVLPALKISNLYGPTEATANAIYAERISARQLYIGKPIANTRSFVLGPNLQPVPVGVTGELYIGGQALARGYWSRPDLTAENFIPDPFSSRPGERLYRTGDLVRWRPDGQMQYVGRSDEQIKLRGFRIELGEIEAVLAQHQSVQQAVVAVQGAGQEKKLVACVVPVAGIGLSQTALRNYVREKLPEYMVPSAFVEMLKLPLTAHGKVDRKALPKWDFEREKSEYKPPCTTTEELLAGIWSEVLGVEPLGTHDNFFDLGGHSLSAMQVTSRLRSVFQMDLPFSAIFGTPTIEGLAIQIERSRRETTGHVLPPLISRDDSGPYPLSFAQQRLWFMDQLHPESTFYNISGAVRLSGELNIPALEQALTALARRHQVLRTRFELRDGGPTQIVEPDATVSLQYEDLQSFRPEERAGRLAARIEEESQKPFLLSQAPLARVVLLQTGEGQGVLFVSTHHIISDGWSVGVLIRELSELYAALSEDRPPSLESLPVQYKDYARWQREYLQGAILERHLNYWRAKLSDAPPVELPTDKPRPAKESFRGTYYPFLVPAELSAGLRNLARSQQSTLFMVLLASWQALLYRYTGQTDLPLGLPVANRGLPETEGLIGFFVNTLVLRLKLDGDQSFPQVLQQTKKTTLEAYDHQDLPFEKLVADLRPERSLSQTPFFRLMFNWVNTPSATLKLSGITWEPIPQEHKTANFDLTLSVSAENGPLPAGFEYSTDLYEEATIAQMANHLLVILHSVVENPASSIATMPLLTGREQEQMLTGWNQTAVAFGQPVCVHELIELQAQTTPNAIAIVSDEEVVTYAELERRANQIAGWLWSRGIKAEVPVGVCLPRSARMLVVLLGILKAGGAYVPLDPSYPPARLKYMVEDSGLHLLFADTSLRDQLSSLPAECIYLDLLNDALANCDTTPARKVSPANAAYTIYTSGSTGRSKGVIATHSSVANQLLWMKSAFSLNSSDRVIHKASVSFDASVAEIFAPLAAGAQVIVAGPEAHHDINSLVRLILEHKVTFIDLSPTLLHALLEHPEIEHCHSLRCIVSGGEVLTVDVASQTMKFLRARLFNTYGPTETTVQSTFWTCPQRLRNRSVPIGKPIANTRVYALDSNDEPVPIGVEGELYIAGAGVARGYLNRPALTAEKFIPDRFSPEPGKRLYRTGDRVRWRRDGALEFLGRTDHQAKVRGFRIETGEIESTLLAHPKVREAAVVVSEDVAGKHILAFIVPNRDFAPTTQELRQHVKGLLPFYMRPSTYTFMQQLPLNVNGKVDRKSLALTPIPGVHKDELPRTATEKALSRIWADVLKQETVGVEDDFFALGGHSFLAVHLMAEIARYSGRNLGLDRIFEYSTPREMARLLDQQGTDAARAALVCMNKGSDDLAPLYVTYPVGGNILCYLDLSRSLSRRKAFYAIQALAGEELQRTTIEEIAASSLRLIKKRDRHGRYELGGWSFGGMVAFEMAQQATAAGDPPAALYLLDPPILEDIPFEDHPDDELAGLFVLTLIADFTGGKSIPLEEIKSKFDLKNSSVETLIQKTVELGLLPSSTEPAAHLESFEIFKRNLRAGRRYRPREYSGKTLLVLRENGRSQIWPTLLPAGTKVVRMPGNHFTLMRGSNAARLAQLIESGADSLLA